MNTFANNLTTLSWLLVASLLWGSLLVMPKLNKLNYQMKSIRI